MLEHASTSKAPAAALMSFRCRCRVPVMLISGAQEQALRLPRAK